MLERLVEKCLFASRWILAPVYLGLSFGLVAIGIKFYQEIFHLVMSIFQTHESNLVLVILGLIDLTLIGGLIVMIMLSGYENFISRLDTIEGDMPDWLSKIDPGSLKLKVAASIVAISSIHLLQVFMNADGYDNSKLLWYVIMHLTFVLSAFLMGILDKVSKH